MLLIVGPCHSSELAGGKRSATGATDTLLSAQGQYEVLGHVTGRIGSMGRSPGRGGARIGEDKQIRAVKVDIGPDATPFAILRIPGWCRRVDRQCLSP